MKLAILGAVMAATLLGALPASAQMMDRDRDSVVVRDRDHMDRGRHEGWRNHHADCGVVKVRRTLPNGRTVVTTRRTCD
jgi:hypothetical protein